MKAVLQVVRSASVECEGRTVSEIDKGFLVLLGVTKQDTQAEADALAAKIAGLRVFADENGKMNLSLEDVGGEVIVVSNFTLCADCSHGKRPSFINAQRPIQANELYEYFIALCRERFSKTAHGEFGADMKVSLVNDGPFTICLEL